WVVWVFRAQIAVVYVHAGLAKVQADWLLHAQPLSIWMSARTDLPVIGPWLGAPGVAYFMAWAGCLYDLTIVGWLSWRRTRALAYGAVLAFHAATHVLFDIGMFPFIMSAAAPIFFAPDWPRRLLRRPPVTTPRRTLPAPARWIPWATALWLTFQALWPLRSHLLDGDVLWDDRGMRFAWKVMVREKQGSVSYRVQVAERARPYLVSPARYLTWRQHSEMASRPEMIAQLAHHVAHDLTARGLTPQAVYADAWVSLNGRPPARLLDPTVNLLRLDASHPGWIRPAPPEPPLAAVVTARSL
ncbi:MAG: HTTM domain-containing protein, partial [Myxococcales bacterium]|nr:HTTM domain-containing protein [Myxococcales bacterium]